MPTASWDLESYSSAGYVLNQTSGRWERLPGARDYGLKAVGANVYWEHPSTEVLCLSYDLCDGLGMRRWIPGRLPPNDLCAHIEQGLPLESHNAMFERLGAHHVLTPRHGFPPLKPHALRCSMATARVNNLPGALDKLGDALRLDTRKDKDGKRLLDKFSVPRQPTKGDPRLRILPSDDPDDFERLCAYCDQDVRTEMAAAARMTPMSEAELGFWLIDQEMNWRGFAIDRPAVRDCLAVLEQALDQYGAECEAITGGLRPSQVAALTGWLCGAGVFMASLDENAVTDALKRRGLPPDARRVLELRSLVGSASVKKLYTLERNTSRDDRLRNLTIHHGASTGRPTGGGAQPLNLPKAGPQLTTCPACAKPYKPSLETCPWCGRATQPQPDTAWKPWMVDHVLAIMAHRCLPLAEWFFGDALLAISGCVRGLFVADEGLHLIASDYVAIEAVVAACLAGEQWRIDAFRAQQPIYLVSASQMTGKPLQYYLDYQAQTGSHHSDRASGKIAELALGYGGFLGALRGMEEKEGLDLGLDDAAAKQMILKWRAASPAIVEMWGGQERNWKLELYGIEGAMIHAVQFPGYMFEVRGIKFFMRDDAMIVTLLSGRELTYQQPRLAPSTRRPGTLSFSYMTYNTNPLYGAVGWMRKETWGSRVFENICQAIAHDIQRFGIINLRLHGYSMVLGVYDEDVVEVPAGFGSIEQVEQLMGQMPWWAADWPIRAEGGWRGRRYRK
jgi:DNA polymerase